MPAVDFYSRASCEARRNAGSICRSSWHFYSRASCEARQLQPLEVKGNIISTHAPRVRRDLKFLNLHIRGIISTHAPRVRRDAEGMVWTGAGHNFYSRASCEARQIRRKKIWNFGEISTHAPRVRRDSFRTYHLQHLIRISTHAPRVRRDTIFEIVIILYCISTHAPRVRRDQGIRGQPH